MIAKVIAKGFIRAAARIVTEVGKANRRAQMEANKRERQIERARRKEILKTAEQDRRYRQHQADLETREREKAEARRERICRNEEKAQAARDAQMERLRLSEYKRIEKEKLAALNSIPQFFNLEP